MELHGKRFGALSGVLASALLMAGHIMTDLNPLVGIHSSSAAIARVFVEHRTKVLNGSYLTLLGVFFLLIFLGYWRSILNRRADRSWLVTAGYGGGLVASAMILLATHFKLAVTLLPDYGTETQVAKALYLLEWNGRLLVEAPGLAALVGTTTVLSFSNKIFPWWINLWGALLTLVLLGPLLPGSGVMVTFLWLAVLSVILFVRSLRSG